MGKILFLLKKKRGGEGWLLLGKHWGSDSAGCFCFIQKHEAIWVLLCTSCTNKSPLKIVTTFTASGVFAVFSFTKSKAAAFWRKTPRSWESGRPLSREPLTTHWFCMSEGSSEVVLTHRYSSQGSNFTECGSRVSLSERYKNHSGLRSRWHSAVLSQASCFAEVHSSPLTSHLRLTAVRGGQIRPEQ